MKYLVPFLLTVLIASGAAAETLPAETDAAFEPDAQAGTVETFGPVMQAASAANEGELQLDFSAVDNPLATPVAVDPIDKPTPTPNPTPTFWYDQFVSEEMGISFNVPGTWLLNPNTNQSTTLQFVEPQSEMMDEGGYQTRVTIEKVDMGLNQTAADAKDRLELVLEELKQSFTTFTPGNIATQQFGDAKGHYCYYRAEYNNGTKTYAMNGRIIIFANGKSLYQVRLTAPRNWYSYYEYVYRNIRSSFKFL